MAIVKKHLQSIITVIGLVVTILVIVSSHGNQHGKIEEKINAQQQINRDLLVEFRLLRNDVSGIRSELVEYSRQKK
jgi:hypothetical protein